MNRCDECSNPATVFWSVTINGHTQEMHLCQECARRHGAPHTGDGIRETGFFFFSPSLHRTAGQTQTKTETTSAVEQTLPTQSEKSLATLKAELKRALRREDYLAAARLRDSIRTLEGK